MGLAPALQCTGINERLQLMIATTSPTDFDTHHCENALTGSAVMAPARALLVSTLSAASIAAVVAGLYLVKSALGINLFPGHSPLHDLLYHFVR